jgi:hypothetical protein
MAELTDSIDLTTDEVLEDSTEEEDLLYEHEGLFCVYSPDFLELMVEVEAMLQQLLAFPCPPLLEEPYRYAIQLYGAHGPLRAKGAACVARTCIYHMYQLHVGIDEFILQVESMATFPGEQFRAFYEAVRAALLYAQRVFEEDALHGKQVKSWLAYLDASVSTPATFCFRDVKFMSPHYRHVPLCSLGIVKELSL